MKKVFLVTYDLHRPGRDYPDLYAAIRATGAWWHYMDSTWLIYTTLGAAEIRNQLKLAVDNNDTIFVCSIKKSWASYNLPDKAVAWLKNHLS